MLFFNFLCLFYLMVLTRCHTISKSIAIHGDFGDQIDSLNDYQSERVFSPRHERLHPKYRREETGKTTELVTTETTTKSKEKTTTLKTTKHAKTGEQEAFKTTLNIETTQVPGLVNATLKPTMNLFRRIQQKFARKNKTKSEKSTTKKQRHKKHKKPKKNETAKFVDRDKRYLKTRLTTDYWDRNSSIFRRFKTTTHKIKNLFFDDEGITTRTDMSSTDFSTDETPAVDTKSNANNDVNYPLPYTSPSEKNTVADYEYDFNTYRGTASIETLLNKIKLHAMNIISEQSPLVSEMITNTVTETTFDADPLLHSLSVTKPLEEPIFFGDDDVELVESVENVKNTQKPQEIQDFKTKATTMAANLEHKLQREIKDALKKAKNTLTDGLNKACDQVKSVTWKVMHHTANGLANIAKGIDISTKAMTQETTPTPAITQDTTQTQIMTKTTSSTQQTKMTSKTKAAKATTRLNRATPLGNLNINVETTTEDDYSMLRMFEDSLAKNHDDNVLKMLTIATPANKVLSLKDVFKVSKRDTETIENFNLKENIRKQNDGERMPDEDYTVDREKTKGNQLNVEVYDDNPSTLTESTIRELSTPDNSYAALSNKIHFDEYINGYKHYLNFARDLTKFDRNFSNRVCYQAHRHHNVDDIGKFILTKLPPIPDWKSSVYLDSQERNKRHFFDSSDIENNDITTKSEESWFRRHFYIFHDKPHKKYHTEQTVTMKNKDAVLKDIGKYKNFSDNMIGKYKNSDKIIKPAESEGLALIWKTSSHSSDYNTQRTKIHSNRWYESGKPYWKGLKEDGVEEAQRSREDNSSIDDASSIHEKLSKLDTSLNDIMNKVSKQTARAGVTDMSRTTSLSPYATKQPETRSTPMDLKNFLATMTSPRTTDFYLNELVSALVLKNYSTNRIKKWHSNSIMENPLNVINKLLSKSGHSNYNGQSNIKKDVVAPKEEVDIEDAILEEISRIKRDERDSGSQVNKFDFEEYTTPYSVLFDQAALYQPSDDKFNKLGYVDLKLVAKPQTTVQPNTKKSKYKKMFNKLKFKKKKTKIKDKKLEGGKSRKERHSPLKMLKNLFKISIPYPEESLYAKTEPDTLKFLNSIDIDRSLREFMKQIPNISKSEVTFKPSYKEPTAGFHSFPFDIMMRPILTTTPDVASYYRSMPKSDVTVMKKEKSSMLYNNANKYTPINFKVSPAVGHTTNTPRLAPNRFHVSLTPVSLDDLIKDYMKYKTDSPLASTPRNFNNHDLVASNPVLITANSLLYTSTPKTGQDIAITRYRPRFQSSRHVTEMTRDVTVAPKDFSRNVYDSNLKKYGIQFHGLNHLLNDNKFGLGNYLSDEDGDNTESYNVKTTFKNDDTDTGEDNYKKNYKYSADEIHNLLYKNKDEKDKEDFGNYRGIQSLMYQKPVTDSNRFGSVLHSNSDGKYSLKYNNRINNRKYGNRHVKNYIGIERNRLSSVSEDNDALTETNKYYSFTKPTEPLGSTKPYKAAPDYFSDFLNWNSDILNIDHVTSPSIDQVMSTLMNATTTVDLIKLREDIRQMKNYLKYLTTRRAPLRQTPKTTPKVSSTPTKRHTVSPVLKRNNKTEKFRRDSVEKEKIQSLDNLNEVINNINKLYKESFKKPYVPDGPGTNDFLLTPILEIDGTASTTEALPMDATLMAYDDNFSLISRKFIPKPKSIRDESGAKKSSPVTTKVNPLPKQYFMTPVPMQPTEFDQFLKENGLDIQNITSPYAGVSDVEEKWERSGNHVESKLMDTRGKNEKFFDYPKKLAGLPGMDFTPQRSGKLFKNKSSNKVVNDPEKYKVTKVDNIFSSERNHLASLNGLDNKEYEEDKVYSIPLRIYDSKHKRRVKTASLSTTTAVPATTPGLHFDITIIDIDDIMKMADESIMNEGSTEASTLPQRTSLVTKTKQPEDGHKISDDDTLDFSPVIDRYPDPKVPEDHSKIKEVNAPKNEVTEDCNAHHGDSYKFEDNLYKTPPKTKYKSHLNKTPSKLKETRVKEIDQTGHFDDPTRVFKLNKTNTPVKENKAKSNPHEAKTNRHNDLLYRNFNTEKYTVNAVKTTPTRVSKTKKYHQTENLFKTHEHKHKILKNIDDFKHPKSSMKLTVKPSGYIYETATHATEFLGDDDDLYSAPKGTNMLNTNMKLKGQKTLDNHPKGLMFSSNTLKYAVYFDDSESKVENNFQKAKKYHHTTQRTEENKYDQMNKLAMTTTKTEKLDDVNFNKIGREVLGNDDKGRRRRKAMWRKWKSTPLKKPVNENRASKSDNSTSKTDSATTSKWFWFLSRKGQRVDNSTSSTAVPISGTSVLVINTNSNTSSPIVKDSLDNARKREERGGDTLVYVVDVLDASNNTKRLSSATSTTNVHSLTPSNITFIFPARVANKDGKTVINKDDDIFVEKPWSTTLQDNLPRLKPDHTDVREEIQAHAKEKTQERLKAKPQCPTQEQLRVNQLKKGQPQTEPLSTKQAEPQKSAKLKARTKSEAHGHTLYSDKTPENNKCLTTSKTSKKPQQYTKFLEKTEPNYENSYFKEISTSTVASIFGVRQLDNRLVFQESGDAVDFPWTAQIPQYHIATIIRYPDAPTSTTDTMFFDVPNILNAPDFEATPKEIMPDTSPNLYTIETLPSFQSSELTSMNDVTKTTIGENLDTYNLENDFPVKEAHDSNKFTTPMLNTQSPQNMNSPTLTKLEESTSCCAISSTKYNLDFGTTINSTDISRELADIEEDVSKNYDKEQQLKTISHLKQKLQNNQNSTKLNSQLKDIEEQDEENEKALKKYQSTKFAHQKQSEQHLQKEIDAALDKIEAAEAKSLNANHPNIADDAKFKSTTTLKPHKEYHTTVAKTKTAKIKEAKAEIKSQAQKESDVRKTLQKINQHKFQTKTTKVKNKPYLKEKSKIVTKTTSKLTSTTSTSPLKKTSKLTTKLTTPYTPPSALDKNAKQSLKTTTISPTEPAVTKTVGSAQKQRRKKRKSNIIKRQTNEQCYTAKDVAALEVIVDLMKEPGESAPVRKTSEKTIHNTWDVHPSTSAIQVHIGVPYLLQEKKRSAVEPSKLRKVFSAKMSVPVDIEYQVRSLDNCDKMISATAYPNDKESHISPGMYLLVEDTKQNRGFALKPVNRQVKQDLVTSTIKTTSPKSLSRVTLSKDYIQSINKQLIEFYQNLSALNNSTKHTIKRRSENNSRTRYRRRICWEKVLEYVGHDNKVCDCKCVPNKPMCKTCAASDAVMSELMFEFENLSKYMSDHCTEIQTFFWMNPTSGRKLRDIVQRIDKSINDYYKRVKGKCQGRPCSCIEKREFTEPVVENYDTYIQKSLLQEFEDLALSLQQVQKLKLSCNDRFKNILDHFVKISQSCIKDYRDKRSPSVHEVYSLDNINVNIICHDNPSYHEISTIPSFSDNIPYFTNDIPTTSDSSILDYTDDEVQKKKTTKSFKRMFAKRKRKRVKTKPIKRDAIVQIESPIVVSETNDVWKEYLKDAKETTVLREPTANVESVLSLGVLEKISKNTVSYNPRLKATLVKIGDTNPNTTDNIILSKRNTRNNDNFYIDKLTTKSESLSNDLRHLIQLFESLPGGQEVKFTAGFLNRHKTTTKNDKTTKKDIEVTMSVKTVKGTSPMPFTKLPNITPSSISSTTATSPSLNARNDFTPKYTATTRAYNSMTPIVARSTSSKETWLNKLKNKVIMLTPVFDNNKMHRETVKISSPTARTTLNYNEGKAVAMNANLDVNSDITTTNYPTLFIIEDLTNHVATTHFDQKNSLLRNIVKYEEDAIHSKLSKLEKRNNFRLEDEMNDFLLLQQDKLSDTAKATTETECAEGDYCICNKLKKLKAEFQEPLSSERSTPITTKTTNIITKPTAKSAKKKSFLKIFEKNKQKTGQQVVENSQQVQKKEQTTTSSPHALHQTNEQQRIKEDMDWFLAQFASTILFESTSSIAYLDKLTESTTDEFDYSTPYITSGYNYTTSSSATPADTTITTKAPSTTTITTPKKTLTTATKGSITSPIATTSQKPSTKTRTVQIVPSKNPTKSSSSISTPISTSEPSATRISSTTKSVQSTYTATPSKTTYRRYSLKNALEKIEKSIAAKTADAKNHKLKTTTSSTAKILSNDGEKHTTEINKSTVQKTKSEFHDIDSHQESTSESILKKLLNKEFDKKNHLKEACDPKTEACLCDIRATSKHVVDVRRTMRKREFERYIRNLTCYRYVKPPPFFLLEPSTRRIRKHDHHNQKRLTKHFDTTQLKKTVSWDWIRQKRDLLSVEDYEEDTDEITDEFSYLNEDHDSDDTLVNDDENNNLEAKVYDLNTNQRHKGYHGTNEDGFEKLYKEEDNVYRTYRKRLKRTTGDMKQLIRELKDLPPLQSKENELFAMLGDKMYLDCLHRSRSYKSDTPVFWDTDRTNMLTPPDVVVDGPKIILNKVHARHTGNYSCSQDGKTRTVKLTVVTLPQFFVVFIPMYSSKHGCSYDDLRAMQHLGPLMTSKNCACARNSSAIKIDEPYCLEDKDDGSILLRGTAILAACQHPAVPCSAQCRRDMQSAFALLCAANAPVLFNVKVVVARHGYNKTLVPSFKTSKRLIVTHTLRKKELPKHPEYHQLATSMYPGNLDIVVSCPAGYSLLPKQKICVACPADTFAVAGENTCYACAPGTSSEPGSARCKLSLRKMRRYDWWWYPPCGYALAGISVLCACVACTACALAAHVTSRSLTRAHAAAVSVARADSHADRSHRYATKRFSSTSGATRGGPPSPSAVILARFFRPSASSSRATDSQETKFEIWKEKNKPPPLPPIDFD